MDRATEVWKQLTPEKEFVIKEEKCPHRFRRWNLTEEEVKMLKKLCLLPDVSEMIRRMIGRTSMKVS